MSRTLLQGGTVLPAAVGHARELFNVIASSPHYTTTFRPAFHSFGAARRNHETTIRQQERRLRQARSIALRSSSFLPLGYENKEGARGTTLIIRRGGKGVVLPNWLGLEFLRWPETRGATIHRKQGDTITTNPRIELDDQNSNPLNYHTKPQTTRPY